MNIFFLFCIGINLIGALCNMYFAIVDERDRRKLRRAHDELIEHLRGLCAALEIYALENELTKR